MTAGFFHWKNLCAIEVASSDILMPEGSNMKLKGLVASLTLGAAAGAAAVLMMPKNSQAYQTMNQAAQTLKMEAGRMWDAMAQS